ncbi:telomere length regulation protein TEL2 homolog [Pelodytes ibericus]
MDCDANSVCSVIQDTIAGLSRVNDGDELVILLRSVKRYFGTDDNPASTQARAEFNRLHYVPLLRQLVTHMGPKWIELLSLERLELWDSFFLEGPADQAFLVLVDSVGKTGPSVRLDRCVHVLERFLQKGALADVIWEVCQQQLAPTPTPVLHDAILWKICSLPDHLANSLKKLNKPVFLPKSYYPRVASNILNVLHKVSDSLRDGKDCSISFVSHILGKICMQGHQMELLSVLVPRLVNLIQSDCIWQRICWRLVSSVPDRWMEPVVAGFIRQAPGPAAVSQLLGDLVLKNKKVEYLLTQKMMFLYYGVKKEVLQRVLGYLSLEDNRRWLLVKVLKNLLEVWSSRSVVSHAGRQQLLEISRSILICLSLMNKEEVDGCKEVLLFALTRGTTLYLESSLPNYRRLGMVVAECLSRHLDCSLPELKFEYEDDEETKELRSLMSAPCVCPSDVVLEQVNDSVESSPPKVSPPRDDVKPEETSKSDNKSDSELDSDDELTPYDMTADTALKMKNAPVYIRDAIEVLLSDDTEHLEATMISLVTLINRNMEASKEVSVELIKILLHLEDRPCVSNLVEIRHGAMVAVTVIDPVSVSEYLTAEFYSVNYNLRQRMDILDVIASAAKSLSENVAPELSAGKKGVQKDGPTDWRKIVEARIASKTKRFAKGSSAPTPAATPNAFHSVAGHFFFPLLQNFDSPAMTFDLLGEDSLVLGRMVHTLGIMMHLVMNAPIAPQMGKALLEFVWVLHFHSDAYVRQGLLFCVSTVLLSVPWERLMTDMSQDILETQHWLADITQNDTNEDTRSAALNSLLLMEKMRCKMQTSG